MEAWLNSIILILPEISDECTVGGVLRRRFLCFWWQCGLFLHCCLDLYLLIHLTLSGLFSSVSFAECEQNPLSFGSSHVLYPLNHTAFLPALLQFLEDFSGTNFLSSLFQAANPGCCLEDFVRWYSPRDYIEEEVVDEKGNIVIKGELSARMKIPSNMWVEAWETAKPIPARRQKRLFDDTREAEKVKSCG